MKIKVELNEKGDNIHLNVDNKLIPITEQEANELIDALIEKVKHTKAIKNGFIFVA